MEKAQPLPPKKSNSFSSSSREEKLRESNRSLSFGAAKRENIHEKVTDYNREERIEEEKENADEEQQQENEEASKEDFKEAAPNFIAISEEIDHFLAILASVQDAQFQISEPPELPESNIETFIAMLDMEIATYESGEQKWSPDHDEICLLDAFNRLHKLTSALTPLSSHAKYNHAMNRTGSALHHAMAFLEYEFFSLLDENSRAKQQDPGSTKTKRPPSFSRPQQQPQHQQEQDRCILPSAESSTQEDSPTYPPDVVERLRGIAAAMISAGYVTECCEVFAVARHNAFYAGLSSLGFEKTSIDDVQKMAWDSLEGEIATWIRAFRHSITVSFPSERELFDIVFSGHQDIANSLFSDLALGAVFQLLNFAEAVALTKRSTEKLFKMLDIYESLRDLVPTIDAILSVEAINEEGEESSCSPAMDLKSEISAIRSRLGEAAVAIFSDLESSIKTDTGKTPVPGGAVHPLTRYVMNYLKYACEYKNTLEQIFRDYQRSEGPSSYDDDRDDAPSDSTSNHGNQENNNNNADDPRPFAAQLMEVMELLHANLESKSKLYKDQALCNIFLMNNGRYVMKKIKGAAEINELLGDPWCRKRSSDLRQYHKNYQRETWSKVLTCFTDRGLNVRGNVSKPVLKERFKSFNALFDEILKTQSTWVVSDEQLQSELRVSISAVVVPAYRSFLGRYSQYLDPGRQTEKYIKFGADDLENYIDELFDGNPSSMARRRT